MPFSNASEGCVRKLVGHAGQLYSGNNGQVAETKNKVLQPQKRDRIISNLSPPVIA